MSEDYDSSELDRGFSFKGKTYGPEYSHNAEQERPVCKHSDRCDGCPYPNHGFVCWGQDGSCMRSMVAKINDIKEKEDEQKNECGDL